VKSELNITDDGINPPALMLGTMTMHANVAVNFDPLVKSELEN